jgi:hypothetical protein
MLLHEFYANYKKPKNPSVKCNALYKTKDSFNCYLTPSQALQLGQHLLEKTQFILDNNLEDAVIQLWNKGESNESVRLGFETARKGPRKKKSKPAP